MEATILRLDRQNSPDPHTLPGPPVALEITRGRAKYRLRPVRGRVYLIGAANDCDLVLGGVQFPDAYAYVFVTGGQVTIRRLGAGPPLVVSGEAVETAELFDGDLIAFEPFELRLRVRSSQCVTAG